MMLRRLVRDVAIVLAAGAVLILLVLNLPALHTKAPQTFGVTFTPKQAESFGLDWRRAYAAILDDLGARAVRLVAYWNDIESKKGEYDFSLLDEQMNELAKRGGIAILAVGRKVPRWPECHDPSWLPTGDKIVIERELFRYVTTVVRRYKDHPALGRWQVENEVLFPFGVCPNMLPFASLAREVALVRSLDPLHSIVVTDSGEWSPWTQFIGTGDSVGSSMYRGAWNDRFGFIPFPIGPGWYQLRAWVLEKFGMQSFTSELQAEPWGKKSVQEMSVLEGIASLSPEALEKNIEFARAVGFKEVYLWGSEWWYWLLQNGDDRIWQMMKNLFSYAQ